MSSLHRPDPTEHAEYYGRYIDLVPDGDIVETLMAQLADTLAVLEKFEGDQEHFRYALDKWTVRDVVGHLVDSERVFAFRALAIARSEVELPGMDQEVWARSAAAGQRPLADLTKEWIAVRRSNVHLFATLGGWVGERIGTASGFEFTVRCFPWIIAGHELWHRRGLERDYLGALT